MNFERILSYFFFVVYFCVFGSFFSFAKVLEIRQRINVLFFQLPQLISNSSTFIVSQLLLLDNFQIRRRLKRKKRRNMSASGKSKKRGRENRKRVTSRPHRGSRQASQFYTTNNEQSELTTTKTSRERSSDYRDAVKARAPPVPFVRGPSQPVERPA